MYKRRDAQGQTKGMGKRELRGRESGTGGFLVDRRSCAVTVQQTVTGRSAPLAHANQNPSGFRCRFHARAVLYHCPILMIKNIQCYLSTTMDPVNQWTARIETHCQTGRGQTACELIKEVSSKYNHRHVQIAGQIPETIDMRGAAPPIYAL